MQAVLLREKITSLGPVRQKSIVKAPQPTAGPKRHKAFLPFQRKQAGDKPADPIANFFICAWELEPGTYALIY
jgi:hypothetical protein